jgi:hypothetical protein
MAATMERERWRKVPPWMSVLRMGGEEDVYYAAIIADSSQKLVVQSHKPTVTYNADSSHQPVAIGLVSLPFMVGTPIIFRFLG